MTPSFISLQDPKAIKVVKATGFLRKNRHGQCQPFNKLFNKSVVRQKIDSPNQQKMTMPIIAITFTNFRFVLAAVLLLL
jgi:hypothetical protein